MKPAIGMLGLLPVLWISCATEPSDLEPIAEAPETGAAIETSMPDSEADTPAYPWDPVWHETALKAWPQRGPEGVPDCGPGCRVAIHYKLARPVGGRHGYSTTRIVDGTFAGLVMTDIGGSSTSLLLPRTEGDSALRPQIYGNVMSYMRGDSRTWRVELMNVLTGETKPVYRHYQPEGDAGIGMVAHNDKFVFWTLWREGLLSRNLATGEIRRLAPSPFTCTDWCATDRGVICADFDAGITTFTDQDTGKRTVIDRGGALQVDALCSPDLRKVAWIDHRDPAGGTSTLEARYGGEVYVRDLLKGETQRVTFDSPANPLVKLEPAVDGNTVIFFSVSSTFKRSPLRWDEFGNVRALERVDLDTGKRCRIDPQNVRFATVHGRHAYGKWKPSWDGESWLVDLDLDSPELPWVCE